MLKRAVTALVLVTGLATPVAFAQSGGWRPYVDPNFGFEIELPSGFAPDAGDDGAETSVLRLQQGDALLDIFGGLNKDGLTLSGFKDFISRSDRIGEVTYSRAGKTWLVLSGYYRRDGYEDRQLVFYTKFMFSPDLSRFSAFEISYPKNEKPRFDPIVERLEDTLSRPT